MFIYRDSALVSAGNVVVCLSRFRCTSSTASLAASQSLKVTRCCGSTRWLRRDESLPGFRRYRGHRPPGNHIETFLNLRLFLLNKFAIGNNRLTNQLVFFRMPKKLYQFLFKIDYTYYFKISRQILF
jgi:hypothetical protein